MIVWKIPSLLSWYVSSKLYLRFLHESDDGKILCVSRLMAEHQRQHNRNIHHTHHIRVHAQAAPSSCINVFHQPHFLSFFLHSFHSIRFFSIASKAWKYPIIKMNSQVVAMDCEMVGINHNGETQMVARVSIVNESCEKILDKYVKPQHPVSLISKSCELNILYMNTFRLWTTARR